MIICHCLRLNDRTIRACVRDGTHTGDQVARSCCGAGSCCGGCRPAIDEIVREERRHLPQLVLLAFSDTACSDTP